MIEIWQERERFQTSQRFADNQKGWFSNLEILEIRQKANNEPDTNTVLDKLDFDKKHCLTEMNHWFRKIETLHLPKIQSKH